MGRHFPPLTRPQIENILRAHNFTPKKTKSKGGGSSHQQWEGYVRSRRQVVTVKKLSRDSEQYGETLLRSMIRQSGLTRKEFYATLGY